MFKKKSLNLIGTAITTALCYFLLGGSFNKVNVHTMAVGILYMILTILINALTSEEYSFFRYIKKVWAIVAFFIVLVYIYWAFMLPEQYFFLIYISSYWTAYIVIKISEAVSKARNRKPAVFFQSEYNRSTLFYYLWLVIFSVFFTPAVLQFGPYGLILGVIFLLVFFNIKEYAEVIRRK